MYYELCSRKNELRLELVIEKLKIIVTINNDLIEN